MLLRSLRCHFPILLARVDSRPLLLFGCLFVDFCLYTTFGMVSLNQQGSQVEKLRAEQAAQREDVRIVHGQIEAAEARQVHRVKELQQAVTQELRRATDELHRWAEKLLEQRVREVYDALEGLNKEVAADLSSMQEHVDQAGTRMDQLATLIEAVQITALGSQRRADVQDQAIADLLAQLQSEAQARKALAEQVAALLAKETEGKPRRKPAS